MSAVIKTVTPFINQEILLQALDCLNVGYRVQGTEIILDIQDYYGNQKFSRENGKFFLKHDSSARLDRWVSYPENWKKNWDKFKSVPDFLEKVEKEYNQIQKEILETLERQRQQALIEAEKIRIEEEIKRMEEERKAFVEKQKQEILKKAEEQGYTYQVKNVGNTVKIVLTKNTY